MTMKVGIYDKWLDALGGGEKVATVIAETLSNIGCKVDLISNSDTEKDEVEKKMGTDLSKVNFVFWSERSYEKLTKLTKKYDLFINVSFLDHLPSKAKKSFYYILFPTPIRKNLLGFIKYESVLPFLRKFLIIPEFNRGLKQIDDIVARGGKWLDESTTFVLRNPPNNFIVVLRIYAGELTLKELDLTTFESPNANIEIIDKNIDHKSNILNYEVKVDMKERANLVFIIKRVGNVKENPVGLVSITVQHPRFMLWNFMKRFMPSYEMGLYGSSTYKPAAGLDTYDLFLADSKFSKKWTRTYWDKKSIVLYPPIDTDEFKPGKKKKMILNVGRFFVGGHSKRHDIMVEAFKKLVDSGKIPDGWELHFVGGVSSGSEHSEYLKKVQEESNGYSVYFHISASFDELKKLYSEATIYWHATGFGVNEKKEPYKMEHFGITPIESMAAGCIPIVYRGGGLTEIVGEDDVLTWKTVSELVKNTSTFINNNDLTDKYSKIMVKKSQKYSREEFAEKLLEYIKK